MLGMRHAPSQDLVGIIFTGFLFTMPEKRGRGVERPVCTDPATRRAALNVLAAAARKSPKAMSVLLDNVSCWGLQLIRRGRNRELSWWIGGRRMRW